MARAIDPDDIDKSLFKDLKLSDDHVTAIENAVMAGWRVIVTSSSSLTLVPYDDKPGERSKRIHLSARKMVPVRKMMNQIRRYGDPQRLAQMDSAAKRLIKATTPQERIEANAQWEFMEDMAKDASDVELAMPQFEPEKEKFVKPAAPTPKQVAAKVHKERHVISERPHMMHKSLGKSYPSKTTIERRWSDGKIDYACAVPTCGSTSDSHLSFRSAHWAMHVRKGEAQPYDEKESAATVVDDPAYTEHAWTRKADVRAKRTEALANMLKGIDLTKMSAEDLAEQIIEWLGDTGSGGNGTGGPMTDAQVLDRIRTLVDRGTYADQEKAILDRDQQISDLMTYAEDREAVLAQEALLSEQRAVKAESTLSAFRDLVAEIMPPAKVGA